MPALCNSLRNYLWEALHWRCPPWDVMRWGPNAQPAAFTFVPPFAQAGLVVTLGVRSGTVLQEVGCRKLGEESWEGCGACLRSCSFVMLVLCTAGCCGYLKALLQNKCTDKF